MLHKYLSICITNIHLNIYLYIYIYVIYIYNFLYHKELLKSSYKIEKFLTCCNYLKYLKYSYKHNYKIFSPTTSQNINVLTLVPCFEPLLGWVWGGNMLFMVTSIGSSADKADFLKLTHNRPN